MAASEAIAVINAGSSSIKFSLYDDTGHQAAAVLKGQVEGLYTDACHFTAHDAAGRSVGDRAVDGGDNNHDAATRFLIGFLHDHLGGRHVAAVGHRIVHGGMAFSEPVRLDEGVLDKLRQLIPLAPLHQGHNLAPVRAIFASAPDIPQVGCFDTAFHAGQAPVAQAFALPEEITRQGVRRYGFHGLSYEYIASVLPTVDAGLAAGRVVVMHLGNGASICAMRAGRSVATTMGFTAVEGLPMGTRSGSLDPGVVLYLMDEMGMGPREVEDLLYKRSGLLGVSGLSSDMRVLEASDDPRARFAIDLFVYRIGREIGSLAAALGGVDALVFTAGIGEHIADVRAAVCRLAGWLGVTLDDAANAANGPRISTAESKVSAWVVPTDEELMIARHTRRLLAAA